MLAALARTRSLSLACNFLLFAICSMFFFHFSQLHACGLVSERERERGGCQIADIHRCEALCYGEISCYHSIFCFRGGGRGSDITESSSSISSQTKVIGNEKQLREKKKKRAKKQRGERKREKRTAKEGFFWVISPRNCRMMLTLSTVPGSLVFG